MGSSPANAKGFTLLEVMVALTITGLALGGLFGVIAGSKRLAWRAEDALVHSSQVRSLINFSQLNDEQGEVFISFENDALNLYTGTKLEMPERKTMATNEELRSYEITDENGDVVAKGTYWMVPDFPEMPPISQTPGGALGIQGGNEPRIVTESDPAMLEGFVRRARDADAASENSQQRTPVPPMAPGPFQ
jgi:prepilin-type N-terminal cleavage/methylation domain-containing protein